MMLDGGLNGLGPAPWLGIFARLAITVMVLAMNAFGDALGVAPDPRQTPT